MSLPRLVTCLAALLLPSLPLLAAPQVELAESQEFTSVVVARDFTRHRVTLRYTGETLGEVYQTGSAAKGLSLQDTRQCHWNFANRYRMEHVRTVSAATGTVEPVAEPLKLQQSADYPLHAPFVSQVSSMAVELGSFIGVQRLEAIFQSSNYVGASFGKVAFNLTFDLIRAVPTVGIRMLARATRLRTGVNCGEAQTAVKASREAYQGALRANMSVVPKVQYYLNAANLYRHWAYLDVGTGRYVGALIVYPGRELPDYLLATGGMWREVRQNMLASASNGFQTPAPTDAEVREFADLINSQPDAWVETLVARYARSFDQKRFDDMKAAIVRNLEMGLTLPAIPASPGAAATPAPPDYVVVFRDYPGPLTGEYYLLDGRTRTKIDTCGHGRLYSVEFADGGMKPEQKAFAEALLERSYGNMRVGMSVQMNQLAWVADHLPTGHALRAQVSTLLDELAPKLEAIHDLDRVYNRLNVAYRSCMTKP